MLTDGLHLVRHRQPGRCTATTRFARVAEHAPRSRPGPRRRGQHPGPHRRSSRSSRRARGDPRGLPRGHGARRRLHRRHRLDAHVLAGQDVDRGPRGAAEAAPPPAHAVQPRPPVGGDRHGLHEPEPVGARRPRVRRSSRRRLRLSREDRRRPLAGSRRRRPDRRLGARRRGLARAPGGSRSRASATTCARSPSPRATRSRPRSGSAFAVNGYGVGDLAAAVDDGVRRGRRPARRRVRRQLRHGAAAAARRRAPIGAPRRRPHRARPARVPRGRRLRCLHRHVRGSRRPASSCPGIAAQRLMADGYGFGAEGDWKTAAAGAGDEGHGHGPAGRDVVHGGLHLPFRPGRAARCSARTCSRSARPSPAGRPSLRDPSAGHRRQGGSGAPGVHRPAGPGASSSASLDLGDRFRLVVNEIDVVEPPEDAAAAAGRPRALGAAAGLQVAGARRGCSPAAPHHTSFSQALTPEHLEDFAEMAGIELVAIGAGHDRPRRQEGAALEPRVFPARPRVMTRT